MPHGKQKKFHQNYGININIDAVKAAMISKSDTPMKMSDSANDSMMSENDLNSSYQSEVSDIDDIDSDGVEVLNQTQPGLEPLSTFMSFKPISKDKVLVMLADSSSFYLKGKVQVKVLQGAVEVQGHTITPSSKFSSLYSPRGFSLLEVKAFGAASPVDLPAKLLNEGMSPSDAKVVKGDCIIMARKLTENWTKFIHSNLNHKAKMNLLNRDANLPEELQHDEDVTNVEKILDINLVHPGASHLRLLRPGDQWQLALDSMEITKRNGSSPRLVVAGGKGVGKSTFLRWLTNKMLAQGPVAFLDLDPGQAELGLPGYLSLGILQEPILGPNFCHTGSRDTQLSLFLGDINVSNCPGRFIQCVKKLLAFLNSEEMFKDLPLVVNTMGWCRGVGLLLLVDTLRLLQPSTLVQLVSRFPRKNYPYSLTPETVTRSRDSWSGRQPSAALSYSLLELEAVPESLQAQDMRTRDYWGLPDPRLTRDLVLLAALGRAGGLGSLPVYRVPWDSVALCVSHCKVEPGQLLAALNLALVDICAVEEREVRRSAREGVYGGLHKTPLVASLGWGVVRNIDCQARVIYLATAASPLKVLLLPHALIVVILLLLILLLSGVSS